MDPVEAAAAIGAVAGGVAGAGYLIRVGWRRARQLGHLLDDVLGEPAREGQPARPSLMARVARIEERVTVIEHEMRPNGGSSVKDQVTAIARATGANPQ